MLLLMGHSFLCAGESKKISKRLEKGSGEIYRKSDDDLYDMQ